MQSDAKIREVLQAVRTIALVGASPKPTRPSNRVMRFLLDKGYHVIPVNLGLEGTEIHGQTVYAKLADVPEAIDMIDVFRASEYVGGIVDEALAIRPSPKVVWMQLDIRDDDATHRAEAEGLLVVFDRCPAIEYPRLIGAASISPIV